MQAGNMRVVCAGGLALGLAALSAAPAADAATLIIEHRGADLVTDDPDLAGTDWGRRPGFEFTLAIDPRRFPGPVRDAEFGWVAGSRDCNVRDQFWQPLPAPGLAWGTFCMDEGAPWPPPWLVSLDANFPFVGVAGATWAFALDASWNLIGASMEIFDGPPDYFIGTGGAVVYADGVRWQSEGPGLWRTEVIGVIPLAPSAAFLAAAGVGLAALRGSAKRRRSRAAVTP